jgi:predicted hydrolase (HD superfamily)
VCEEIIHAVKAHNEHVPRDSRMDRALYASDPVTGLIVASALMHPDKKLSGLDVDFVMRRFKEKRFAAGADRDQIAACSELGLSLEEFLDIAIASMQGISDDLGL